MKILFILIIVFTLASCSFVRVSLSKEEREKIVNPPADIQSYVDKYIGDVYKFMSEYHNNFSSTDIKSLSTCMLGRAEFLGVINPKKIQVIITNDLPIPKKGTNLYPVYLKTLGDPRNVGAMVFGYNIYIKPFYSRSYNILIHELIHILQYQKYGEKAFLRKYMIDSQIVAYAQIPFESEALTISAGVESSKLEKCEKLYKM